MAVLNGSRPVRPEKCPDSLWKIINGCWAEDASIRPSASRVASQLEKMATIQLSEESGVNERSTEHRGVTRVPGACYRCQKLKVGCDFDVGSACCKNCLNGGHKCVISGRKPRSARRSERTTPKSGVGPTRSSGACDFCRRLRMKCDYKDDPNRCARCSSGGRECVISGRSAKKLPRRTEFAIQAELQTGASAEIKPIETRSHATRAACARCVRSKLRCRYQTDTSVAGRCIRCSEGDHECAPGTRIFIERSRGAATLEPRDLADEATCIARVGGVEVDDESDVGIDFDIGELTRGSLQSLASTSEYVLEDPFPHEEQMKDLSEDTEQERQPPAADPVSPQYEVATIRQRLDDGLLSKGDQQGLSSPLSLERVSSTIKDLYSTGGEPVVTTPKDASPAPDLRRIPANGPTVSTRSGHSSHFIPKLSGACDRCKALMVRCEFETDADRCKRCLNGGLECIVFGGIIEHTDDSAMKLVDAQARRQCYNCGTIDASTWRRSTRNPGEVLCNKCGLFERTHSRPRPDQFPHKQGPLSSAASQRDDSFNGDAFPPPEPEPVVSYHQYLNRPASPLDLEPNYGLRSASVVNAEDTDIWDNVVLKDAWRRFRTRVGLVGLDRDG
ncbi:hypothetical protein V5O48_011653 [Marasmius crinis-equi]|uniref:Zn(2)-C6 fungal-type domain-containing protein n=1 Tax=Marasmius crinis-equi TaxID=585013 RepID=A0ABR3F5D3_9AGAR